MRLKLYRAATVAQAMAQVRSDLGPEALILSTRRTGEGVVLTAAIDPDDVQPAPLPTIPVLTASEPQPSADVLRQGLPASLAAMLGGPDLKGNLAALLRFGPLPGGFAERSPHGRLLLAGLPGAGKTLSIARLATQLVLAGVRPAVITADGRRAGAAEELAAYTRLLGLDLMVASTPATLKRALTTGACQAGGPVLIDTSGINPFVTAELDGLAELARAAEAEPVLVMAAGQDAEDSADQAEAFARAGVAHLLVTRLDLARRVGGVVMAAHAGKLTLTLACGAACATVPAEPMTPALLAGKLGVPTPSRTGADRLPALPRRRSPVFPAARTNTVQNWSADRHV